MKHIEQGSLWKGVEAMFGKSRLLVRISDQSSQKMKKKRKAGRRRIISIVCTVLLAAVGVLGLFIKARSGAEVNASTVKSAQVRTGDVSTTISSSGTLYGEEIASINLPVGIKIKKVLVSEGDQVKKGTRLASIYPASAAELLLTVRESIEDTEDELDDLDEDEIADTTSDDYLKKLTLDQELSDLQSLETQLETIVKSGYITADQAGIIAAISIADDTEISAESVNQTTDSSNTGSTGSKTTSSTASSAVSVTCATAASTPVRLAGASVSALREVSGTASEESTTEHTEDDKSADPEEDSQEDKDSSDNGNSSGSQGTESNQDKGSSKDTVDESAESDTSSVQESSKGTASSSDSSQSNQKSSSQSGDSTDNKNSNQNNGNQQGSMSGGNAGNPAGGGSGSGGSSSGTSTSSEASAIGDIDIVSAITLNSDSRMLVTVSVDEADIESVKVGQNAEITLNALSDQTLTGQITEVGKVASDSSESVRYPVKIAIDKSDNMRQGMSASAVIYIEKAENTLVIPSAAIQEEAGKSYVYTEKDSDDNLSGKKEVTTGLSDGSQVQINEGLEEGDTVYYTVLSKDSGSSSGHDQGFGHGAMEEGMPGGTPPSGGPDNNMGHGNSGDK